MHDPTSAEYKYKSLSAIAMFPGIWPRSRYLHTLINRYTIPAGREETASTPRKNGKIPGLWRSFASPATCSSIHDVLDASEYIENQLKEDELGDQLRIPGTGPFTGDK